jgi:2-dehydro-3-deoxyglucarate aldolase
MQRANKIQQIRKKLSQGEATLGSWIQIPHTSVAEIMGKAGYDWVAVDLEHGSISTHQLPGLFMALELGDTLPLVRLAQGQLKDCKQALDAGAGGVIVPMVTSSKQIKNVQELTCWPPTGKRGVGFSRANLFGKYFTEYTEEAQAPLIVAQIEHVRAVDNLEDIVQVRGLDAIMIGPYDLSASMGICGDFENPIFQEIILNVKNICEKRGFAFGIHVVNPEIGKLQKHLNEGYSFIAYSTDAAFLNSVVMNPINA